MKRRYRILALTFILLFVFNLLVLGPHAQQQYLSNYYSIWRTSPIPELTQKAASFAQTGQADSALHYYSMVANRYYEKQYQSQDVPMIIRSLTAMGDLYHFTFFDYQQSYDCLSLAEKLSIEHDYREYLPSIYLALAGIAFTDGNVHQYQNYIPDAITLYKKSYNEALDQQQYVIAVKTFINIINFSADSTSLAGIADEIASFEQLTDVDIPLYHYAILLMRGTMAQVGKDYAAAISYYQQMEPYVSDSDGNNYRYRLVISSRISSACFLAGDEARGIEYLHEMEKKVENDSIIDLQVDAYRVLNLYYTDHHNPEKAQYYRMRYLEAKDEMLEKHNLEAMKNAKFLNELNLANEEIRRINYEHRMQRWLLLGVSLFAVLLLVLIGFIVHHNRELQARNRSIYRQMVRSLKSEQQNPNADHPSTVPVELMSDEVAPTEVLDDTLLKYRNYSLAVEEKERIYQKILEAMRDVDMFCSESFSLQVLADRIVERPRYVSQVINERYGGNFPSFVNEYRIREACRRIMDQEHFGQLSLAGIGESVGIKSRSQFSSIFKKVVGMTAAEYLREAKK